MFKYLVITRNGLQLELEEESGTTLYRTREFLRLLKDRFPEVIFTRFKGKPTRPEFGDLDLVLITPHDPPTALLGQLIEGYLIQLVNSDDPGLKVRLAKHELKIDLGGRKKREVGGDTLLADRFETSSRKLVAILRMEAVDPQWLHGTSARLKPETRFGFFVSTRQDEIYNGRRGSIHVRGGRSNDGEDH
jgi:hypothetical protein